MKFGFVGLGQMGKPMAINLGKTFDVIAYDQRPDALSDDAKTKQVGSLSDLAECTHVFLSLPSSKVLEIVLFDKENGLAGILKPGTVIVDTSTVEYNATVDIGNRLDDMGLRFLDAPVSGMQKRAEDGTLTMMIGGEKSLARELDPAMSAMANKILYMGPRGAGQLTKLINQLLFDVNMAALAEILPVSVKLGLDPEQMADVINSGTGRSYASEFFLPNILEGIFDQGYPMRHAYKDLISGAELGARHAIPLSVLGAATATYQRALLEGLGDQDKGAMVKVFENLLGVAFRKSGEGAKK
ncbi:NAD(P)-dependent oxidoreductase [Microbaculum sp. FT89]|uniref:NAD(P)-dependent oxidoreductase n=1 Tax=Microbaculum sp. FT89 TaxID=3447298 RepID=UPI003F52E6BF